MHDAAKQPWRPPVSEDTLRRLQESSGGRPGSLSDLFEEYLGTAGVALGALRSAIERGDGHAVAPFIQTLKAASSALGVGSVVALTERAERLAAEGRAPTIEWLNALDHEIERVGTFYQAELRPTGVR